MTHNLRLIICLVALTGLITCGTFVVFGGETPDGIGAGLFTQLGLDARTASLGGASVASPDGPSGAYSNPASLGSTTDLILGGMHCTPYGRDFGVSYQYISILGPLGVQSASLPGVGLTWMNSKIDDIPLWDNEGLIGVTSSLANVYMVSAGFSLPIPSDLSIGVSVRYYTAKLLEGKGEGMGLDIGFLATVPTSLGDLTLGLNSMDTGNTIIGWDSLSGDTRNITPWTIKTGVAYLMPTMNLLITADCDIEITRPLEESGFHAGIEYHPVPLFMLRAGIEKGFGSSPRLSAGFGINIRNALVLDYAYLPGVAFSDTHLFTASFTLQGLLSFFD